MKVGFNDTGRNIRERVRDYRIVPEQIEEYLDLLRISRAKDRNTEAPRRIRRRGVFAFGCGWNRRDDGQP